MFASIPVCGNLQAQRHLLLQQALVLHNEMINLLAQLLFLCLQPLHMLLPKQEKKQEEEGMLKAFTRG